MQTELPVPAPLHDFPEGYTEHRTLKNGLPIVLRPIAPDDRDALAHAFRSLSEETIRRRFHGVVTEPSEETLRYLTEVDQKDHVAIVAVVESPDLKTERGIGVARFIRTREDPKVAEAAVTVIDAYQGQGVGRHLLTELSRIAQHLGVHHFRAEVLSDNQPVRAILERVGASPQGGSDGATVFDVALVQPEAEASLFELFRTVAASMSHALERVAQVSARLGSAPREAIAQVRDSARKTLSAASTATPSAEAAEEQGGAHGEGPEGG